MRRTDYYPHIGGCVRKVSVGKRAHKGLIIMREIPPNSSLSRAVLKTIFSRMEEYEREQVRVMALYQGLSWWVTDLQALPASSEEDGWTWLQQN